MTNDTAPSRQRSRTHSIRAFLALALAFMLGLTTLTASPAAAATAEDDVATVISRLQEYYLGQGDEIIIANGIYLARTSEALDYVASQNPDGSWSDVNYADRTSSANGATWSAYIALYRMLALTHAYRDPAAAGFEDPTVLAAIQRALVHWNAVDPGNSNWWETEIGESIAMGRISIFLKDVLGEQALAVALKHNTGKLDPVGANGAWRTTNYLFEAFATENLDNIAAGFATMVATIAVDHSGTVQEAVQPDASFWAHGAQLYSEGYGMVLFTTAALWADVARGTSLAFSREQLDAIAFYAIDGTRWLIRGEIGMLYLNYRAPKTTSGITSHASEFIEPLQRMVRTDPLYATAYQGVLDGVLGETTTNGVTGNKYFWRSEFSSHLRDEYGIFTRLNSSRTFGAELRTAYDEQLGNPVYWNAMGSTAIQVTNREYLDLGPTFDWWHYPGVTAPYVKRTERGVENRGRNGDGASFTGGVSNGTYGLSVLTLDTAGTNAQKSYFSFDDEMVALGTGIRSTSTAAVHTTINQATAVTNATVGGGSVAAGTDAASIGGANWAYNDHVGYVVADGQDVKVSLKAQTGNWPDEAPLTRDAFSLFIDHGVAPTAGAYDYTVLPAATPAAVEAYAAAPAVRTLRNDGDVQAVRHDALALTMATFFRAGSLDLGGGRSLTVDQPTLVLLDESGAAPVVSIANPDRPGLTVALSLTGGGADWSGVFGLGSGENLGKTVTASLASSALSAASDLSASSTASGSAVASLGDGNRDTVWTSRDGDTEWVAKRLALGSWVTNVGIDWADGFASDYLVQTSSDGIHWTDQTHVTGATGDVSQVPITPTAATYVRVVLLGTDAASFGIRELTVSSSVNLAIGSATRASGYAGYNLVYALADGDTETRWRGNNANSAWAQIDLGTSQPVSTVRLRWEAAFAKAYKIQLSDDGSSWRDAYVTPSGGSDGGLDVITLDGQNARFVRMQTVTRALDYGPSLWEFEVFGDRLVVDAPVVPTGKGNLALNRPTTADSVHNNNATIVASKATDGSASTKWSSARAVAEHWLQVDLGAVQSVSRAVISWEAGTSNSYRVEGSVDGGAWVELARVDAAQPTLKHTLDFAAAHVRYVKLTGLPATQYGLNIWEFELYGGVTLECAASTSVTAGATTTISASVQPLVEGDTFAAVSLDADVARVVGDVRVGGDGRIEVDVTGVEPGVTSVVLTHTDGAEVAQCAVIVSAELAALTAQIDRASALVSTEYTPESWVAVLPARDAAKAVRAEVGATQARVDAAAAALAAALDALVVPLPPDSEKPTVTLVSPATEGPWQELLIQVDAADNRGLAKIAADVYDVDGELVKATETLIADGALERATPSVAPEGVTTASHTATVRLPEGAYTVRYYAQDTSGNVSETGMFAVTIEAESSVDEAQLTVSKTVVGPGTGAAYDFTAACTVAGDGDDQVEYVLAPGDASFALKDGEKRVITVPAGATCLVSETNVPRGATVTYLDSDADTRGGARDGLVANVSGADNTVKVTNTFAVPPGLAGTGGQILAGAGFAGAALLLIGGALVLLVRHRRTRRDLAGGA